MSDHEEEFYYQEVAVDHMSSPPTMSHRDMARPPHEDPEYQKQLRLEATPATNNAENMLVGIRERNTVFAISQSPVRNKYNSRPNEGTARNVTHRFYRNVGRRRRNRQNNFTHVSRSLEHSMVNVSLVVEH